MGRWSFKSLYCCSSFLLVRACRFLPTEQRISLARACLRGPLSPFFISSLHLFPSRTAAFFFFSTFPPLELCCGVSTTCLKCLQTPKRLSAQIFQPLREEDPPHFARSLKTATATQPRCEQQLLLFFFFLKSADCS